CVKVISLFRLHERGYITLDNALAPHSFFSSSG
ncbi:uncharacterized protein METZ01_LOCUS406375, partial [marine metagenome]